MLKYQTKIKQVPVKVQEDEEMEPETDRTETNRQESDVEKVDGVEAVTKTID